MFKISVFILVSIFCVSDASFRTEDDRQKSFAAAKAHPASGAALVVIAEAEPGSGQYSEFNATYLGDGIAVTHSHQRITPERTWVVSTWAGATDLTYQVSCFAQPGRIPVASSITLDPTSFDPTYSRVVTQVLYPQGRETSHEGGAHGVVRVPTCVDDLPFYGAEFPRYVSDAIKEPLKVKFTDRYLTGTDFCLLQFAKFPDDHPVTTICKTPFGEGEVEILGRTTVTHLYDGSGERFSEMLRSHAISAFPKKGGKRVVKANPVISPMKVSIDKTCFSQFAQRREDRLIVVAACGSTEQKPDDIDGNEIFNPDTTDPRTTAVVVEGLSGSGVYIRNALGVPELVAVVSTVFKSGITEGLENAYTSSKAAGKSTDARERDRLRSIHGLMPSQRFHPLLDIHQVIGDEQIKAMLEATE